MTEFIKGILILIIPLMIVFIIIFRSYKNFKSIGKWFVLKDEKTKWWHIVLSVIFFTISIYAILSAISIVGEQNNPPIRIIPEQYNLWGWYT